MKKSITAVLLLCFIVLLSCSLKEDDTISSPSPPPLPKKILFSAVEDGNLNIFTMNIDGEDEKQLTHYKQDPEGIYAKNASWSPDGLQIVFETNNGAEELDAIIYIMNADGIGDPIQLGKDGRGEERPKISPDGTKILFEGKGGEQQHTCLFTMNIDGTGETQLTEATESEGEWYYTGEASWSPDGSKIIFVGQIFGREGASIYEMNADGKEVTEILHKTDELHNPVYSPDGNTILFEVGEGTDIHHLFTMNADGEDEKQLTPFGDQRIFIGDASWHPDGSKIVFTTNKDKDVVDDSERIIYIMDADGKNPIKLGQENRLEGQPSFFPDRELRI